MCHQGKGIKAKISWESYFFSFAFPQWLSERKLEHRVPLTQQIYPKPGIESEKPTASQVVWFIISDGAALWSCALRVRQGKPLPSPTADARCVVQRPLRSPAGWTPALTSVYPGVSPLIPSGLAGRRSVLFLHHELRFAPILLGFQTVRPQHNMDYWYINRALIRLFRGAHDSHSRICMPVLPSFAVFTTSFPASPKAICTARGLMTCPR